jgi:hypothetical protein
MPIEWLSLIGVFIGVITGRALWDLTSYLLRRRKVRVAIERWRKRRVVK